MDPNASKPEKVPPHTLQQEPAEGSRETVERELERTGSHRQPSGETQKPEKE